MSTAETPTSKVKLDEGRDDAIDVVVRCRNEMPYTSLTLAALAAQRAPRARVLFLDCQSSDGSREVAEAAGVRLGDVEASSYRPGEVINRAMTMTNSEVVAFINADAIPASEGALGRLIAPLRTASGIAASFGRQLARPTASALTRADYQRAFGDGGALAVRHGPFFSMAASALRREVWQMLRFDETLRYSEDADWVRRASALGWEVAYAPAAEFEHSHDYDLTGQYRRRRGEGAADAAIHRLGRPSPLADLARPLAGALVRDARSGVLSPTAMLLRAAQAAGYFAGRWGAGR